MTEQLKQAALADRLRAVARDIRRKPYPISDIIPLLNQAADALTAAQPAQAGEREAWVPYLVDRADGVKGHYAIGRWNPRGYREVWNLHSHRWAAYSDDVMSLEEADSLLRQITIPTARASLPTQPAAQATPESLTRSRECAEPMCACMGGPCAECPEGEREKEIADLRASRDFYKRRADSLQQAQSRMRDPERTMVCDILANGALLAPAGDRYAATPEPVTLIREMATRIKAANPGDAFFTLQILDALVKKLSAHARATPPQQAAGEPVGEVSAESILNQWMFECGVYLVEKMGHQWASQTKQADLLYLVEKAISYTHPAPGVPEIDYQALIHAAWGKHKYAQGSGGCIAFKRGAEWFRDIALAAAQAKGGDPEDLAAAGVMLTGRRSDHA